MKKLLIVGSNTIHTYNYIALVEDYFDEVLLITNERRPGYTYNIVELNFGLSIKNMLSTTSKLRKAIKSFNPSVIHIHQANSYAFYSFKAIGRMDIPVVLTAWGSDILTLPKTSCLMKKMVSYNLKKADYLTSDSTFMAEEMKELVPEIKPILIANFGIGVDFQNVEKENIIYSNRLHKKLYRIDKIIESFERFSINRKKDNWKLVIAATGEETDNLKQLAENSEVKDCISFVGWVDQNQNAEWYSKAKIWVSIPKSDATSISLLEAMACGCIPVVSDLPANKEWIVNGQNGVIVEDLTSDFISLAFQLNGEEAVRINKDRIALDGTKEANKKKFIQLYKKLGL